VRTRLLVPVTLLIVLGLAACGGSSSSSSSPTTTGQSKTGATTAPAHVAKPVSNKPSISAQMICGPEAIKDIYESATGVKTVSTLKPTWIDHVYACDYVYPAGAVMHLSVKEFANSDETTAYFDSLATKLDKKQDIKSFGQPAFQTQDGSIVVRKDFKVLTVDVSKLPGQFGVPVAPRGDVAINVGAALMGCWTGQ
jgi:hypothetical protein